MKNTKNAALVAVGAAALPLLTAFPASAAPEPSVKAQVVRSACPGEVSVSENGSRVTVKIKNFKAAVGGDVDPQEAQKSCSFSISLRIPQGFTWAVASTETRLKANLDPGVVGELTQSYRWRGSPGSDVSPHAVAGRKGNLQFTDMVPTAQLKYARCDAPDFLDLETRIRVQPSDPSEEGWLSLDFPEGGMTYSFAYKVCDR
ncbi:DUF4360 domain-containing protein [Actinomadura litoris]|uniref:DUF4360 domain-containing protein n=1 Tax=Actinomadura litoris TaxID=2678616 RepID=UPI001FA75B80|nr:DUF4360 domain-containing protein [Actinomadura litoris]